MKDFMIAVKALSDQNRAILSLFLNYKKRRTAWLQGELGQCYEPLLSEKHVLDIDPTMKPLYGNQEGAEVGYNPKKPGRPSHSFHSYFIAETRLLLDVDVRPRNQTAGIYSHDGLWNLLDKLIPANL
jgi:hypothetical protein